MARAWSDSEEAVLRDGIAAGRTNTEIAELLGRGVHSVAQKVFKLRISSHRRAPAIAGVELERLVAAHQSASTFAPVATAAEPDDAFLARVIGGTSRAIADARQERYVRLRIVADHPVAVSLSSDWHLSCKGPAHVAGLLHYADAVAACPRAYALGVGDMTDNPIKHKPTAVLDVPDDLRLLDLVLQRFDGKLMGLCSGNHDDWTRTMVGVDALKTMAERHRLHYAPDELIWVVEIADPTDEASVTATWIIATRHKFRRHSNLNHTHAGWRWLEENMHNWPHDEAGAVLIPDIVAIGHNHVAAVEHRTYERGTVIVCRMGAWQYTSSFTRAGGWALMPPTAPTIVLPCVRDGNNQPHAYEHYEDAFRAVMMS